MVDRLPAILGKNITVDDMCTVVQYKLSDLADPKIMETYQKSLALLSYNTDDVIDLYQAREDYEKLPDESKKAINEFDLIVSVKYFRTVLEDALNFFLVENTEFDESLNGFLIYKGKKQAGLITALEYKKIRSLILELNYISIEKAENEHVFANKKAKSVFEKLKSRRKKKQIISDGPDLSDIVSAVAVQSQSYNLLNIENLTIYQLYDQFYRIDTKTQVDICGLKWAAWGTEPFDFSVWYKTNK